MVCCINDVWVLCGYTGSDSGESEVESEGIMLSEYDHYLYVYVTTCSFVLKMMIVIPLEMDATFMSRRM